MRLLFDTLLIKFVIPNKENDEQLSLIKRTSIYCKIRPVVYMAQDELRNEST